MRRRLALALGMLLATAAGVASASVVTPGDPAVAPAVAQPEEHAADTAQGQTVADPAGGPRWAVRIMDGASGARCIAVARTEGDAFGPVDDAGHVVDTDAIMSGSCADPASHEPLQLGVALYGARAGQGPRTVLFGVADPAVADVAVTGPDGRRPVALDAARTFAIVYAGLAPRGSFTATVTLADGTTRTYRL